MPLVQIKGVGGYLSMEQKQEMIRCRAVAEAEGMRPVTWVTIEDVEPGAWGVAGEPVTDDNLKQMAAQDK